jgi:DNA topoisomerase VI subunit A
MLAMRMRDIDQSRTYIAHTLHDRDIHNHTAVNEARFQQPWRRRVQHLTPHSDSVDRQPSSQTTYTVARERGALPTTMAAARATPHTSL